MNSWENVDARFFSDKEKCKATVRNERKAICEGCPSFENLNLTCKECQCGLPAKVWIKDTVCPIGKW